MLLALRVIAQRIFPHEFSDLADQAFKEMTWICHVCVNDKIYRSPHFYQGER